MRDDVKQMLERLRYYSELAWSGSDANAFDCAAAMIKALEKDAAIGRLVRQKMTSGNSVAVERCTVTAAEVQWIDAGNREDL